MVDLFSDVEAAAKRLVEIREAGGMTPDQAHGFLMAVENPRAVLARADEIEAERDAGKQDSADNN